MGRDNSVGIVTSYGLGRSVDRILAGTRFSAKSRTDLGPPSLLYYGYRVFPGVKRPGNGVDHPLHLAPKLKKE